ncbi:hypothetical protein PoB_006133900 [Plakobranchus ocellatus]|uniref:Uncharacterized protein n=1 Tax=Plakobranchus ocellatus TaxID=259542 RepID=A0AAV4CSG4_9GAST|nr:hypothetical protein PoB_006133900 [Plakobranchus ocellatus]
MSSKDQSWSLSLRDALGRLQTKLTISAPQRTDKAMSSGHRQDHALTANRSGVHVEGHRSGVRLREWLGIIVGSGEW